MKNKFLKYCTAVLFLCTSTIVFAQPGDNDGGGGLEGNDPAAPIDDYVGILALAGFSYVLYKVKANQKEEKVS
jgi:hypothetical protein